ncbi:MAG: acetolactate synthase small subunit [Anaerovoracaceae bacterium]
MKHIISALMENRPGVLRRLSGLFGRRGYNIESIVASATENPDVTRMTIVVDGDEYIIDQVIKQLVKLQEIIEVENVTDKPVVSRQLLIMKLGANMETRKDILQLAEAFRARILDIKADSIMIEATADDYVTDSMVETFKPYGIISMMKTGMVALKK